MNIYFRTNASGIWNDIGSNSSVYDGTYSQISSNMDDYATKYWWSVNCTDEIGWTNQTYYFTTTGLVSIDINQSNYAFPGIKKLNNVYFTNETDEEFFGIINNGEVSVDLKISATDMSCSYGHIWTLTTINGPNQYVLEYSEDGGNTWHFINSTSSTFYTDLGIGNTITLDLRLTMPSSLNCGHEMGCTVSVDAIPH
jgi:hypothetical protein